MNESANKAREKSETESKWKLSLNLIEDWAEIKA